MSEIDVVSKPLCTLDDLLSWEERSELSRSVVKLDESYAAELVDNKRSKLLVCHDMKGGYLNDRFVHGCKSLDFYRFSSWWRTDLFVYFSHHLVTIPPPCWIDVAHRHGVAVLGTFITESHDEDELDGKRICLEIFSRDEMWMKVANQLAACAAYYRFDGWLINIENTIEAVHMKAVSKFLEYLTERMHSTSKHSRIIWYDSVTIEGDLKWQDELNDLNRPFFDVTNGIFLNYCWTKDKLITSCSLATESRKFDVFVGCDVFGRGCFGGGGVNTNLAIHVANECQLSSAMFAPAWTLETFGEAEFEMRNSQFWNVLEDYVPHRKILTLPVRSSFCQGWGHKYFYNGKVIMDGCWTSLSLQQLQPTEFCSTDPVTASQLLYVTTDGYMGGGCLQICTAHSDPPTHIKLLDVEVQLIEDQLKVSYTVKGQREVMFGLYLKVLDGDLSNATNHLLIDSIYVNDVNTKFSALLNQGNVVTHKCISPVTINSDNKWITREFTIKGLRDKTLQEVSAVMMSNDESITRRVLLGQLEIVGVDQLRSDTVVYERLKDEIDTIGITGHISVCSCHTDQQQRTRHSSANSASISGTVTAMVDTTANSTSYSATDASDATNNSIIATTDATTITSDVTLDATTDSEADMDLAAFKLKSVSLCDSDIVLPTSNELLYSLIWRLDSDISDAVSYYFVYMRIANHSVIGNWKLIDITPRSYLMSVAVNKSYNVFKDVEFAVDIVMSSGLIIEKCALHLKPETAVM